MKLAFVGYRDFGDRAQFEQLPFTDNVDEFRHFLARIHATGGDDGPEDVFGGLQKAVTLNWSMNAGTKVMFHIADAPCHGNEFHAGIRDNYPGGDPQGRTTSALFTSIRQLQIAYYFGKITPSTDKMIGKFSVAYGEPITDFNVKNIGNITDSVVVAVSESVSVSIMKSSQVTVVHRALREHVIVSGEPNWASLPTFQGWLFSFAHLGVFQFNARESRALFGITLYAFKAM